MKFNIPIVIIVYNRPKHTEKLLNIIKNVNPRILVIISDGPKNNKTDKLKCRKVKEVIENINLGCKKIYISSKENIGLKYRIYSGLNIFFKKFSKGIILEDDCIPVKSFFYYCRSMLKTFKNEKRISKISGCKHNDLSIANSFYFSKFGSIWGWATWRRSWNEFDIDIKFWPKYKISEKWIKDCPDIVERSFWNNLFDKVYIGEINSWAYPFLLNNFYKNKLSIVPKYNLIRNVGFGKDSTNTKIYNKKFFPKTKFFEKKIKYPDDIKQFIKADNIDFSNVYGGYRRNKYPLKFFYMIYLKLIKFIFK